MTTRKVYPDQLNPFGEEDDDDDDKNPFKSDEDEEEEAVKSTPLKEPLKTASVTLTESAVKDDASVNHSGTLLSPRNGSLTNGKLTDAHDDNKGRNTESLSLRLRVDPEPEKPKPSPLPRRSLLQADSPKNMRPQSALEGSLAVSPLPRANGSVGDLPTTPIKRRAPSIPSADAGSLRPLPSPEKSPLIGGKKKLAPPPPPGGKRPDGSAERRKSSTDVDVRNAEEKLNHLTMSSGHSSASLTVRRDSNASSVTGLTPDRQSLNQNLTSSTEDFGEQQYQDLMGALRAEHDAIENELRELMTIPTKLRSAAQIAREQRLMKDLLDNVKRRDELEDEEEELERTLGDAGNPAAAPKKMKKKRKFKMKNLLGGK